MTPGPQAQYTLPSQGIHMLPQHEVQGNDQGLTVYNPYRRPVGSAIMRLIQFFEGVSNNRNEIGLEISVWKNLVGDYFSENGVLKFAISDGKESKQFEVPSAAISRLYLSFFEAGVKSIQLCLENPREYTTLTNGYFVDCSRAFIIFTYKDGSVVTANSPLRVLFNQALQIEWMEQAIQNHVEYLSRSVLMTVKAEGESVKLPSTELTGFGVNKSIVRFLEISGTIAHMRDLMTFSSNPGTGGPIKALEALAKALKNRTAIGDCNGKSTAATAATTATTAATADE